jgi:tRNA pseudouridine13 synthase
MSLPEPGREPFLSSADGIAGRLRATPEDFAVAERELLPPETADGRHTIVRVTARNRETNLLVRDLARALGIQPRAIGFAGTKDKRAVTTQLMSVRASPEALAAVALSGITLEPLYRTPKPLRLGQLRGNRFTIRVADAEEPESHVPAILAELAGRFPNYFGVQRFGASRPVTHLVGEALLRGDWQHAVKTYISAPATEAADASEARAAAEAARAHYRDTGDLPGTLEALPGHLLFERQLVGHLLRQPDDWQGALQRLPPNLQQMFIHAAQSALFNAMVAQRLAQELPLDRPEEGDIVLPADRHGGPDQRAPIAVTVRNQPKLAKRCAEGKAWVTALLPGLSAPYAKGPQGDIERQIVAESGIARERYALPEAPRLASDGLRRPIHATAQALEWSLDDGVPEFRFALDKGTYATSFMREIMKAGDLRAY